MISKIIHSKLRIVIKIYVFHLQNPCQVCNKPAIFPRYSPNGWVDWKRATCARKYQRCWNCWHLVCIIYTNNSFSIYLFLMNGIFVLCYSWMELLNQVGAVNNSINKSTFNCILKTLVECGEVCKDVVVNNSVKYTIYSLKTIFLVADNLSVFVWFSGISQENLLDQEMLWILPSYVANEP